MDHPIFRRAVCAGLLVAAVAAGLSAAETTPGLAGAVPRFRMAPSDIRLSRPAQPFTYFDKVGRKFAVLGTESGSFEAWAYPLKLLRGFSFSFLVGTSTVPVEGKDIVRFVSVDPAVTTLTFTFQSFTVKAHYIAAADDPGAVILLEVDAIEPLTIVCSFTPVLQPMWPAGLGGQYAAWDEGTSAYIISEPTRKNHGLVGSPTARGISYTPAHMLSDVPNQFKIEIADPKAAAGVYIPVVLAGGKGKREDVKAVYQRLAADPQAVYDGAVKHFRDLSASSLRIKTPEPRLDLAFEWAKVALDSLLVENPDLGRGLVAGLGASGTGGRPGFGWFFGTDAYLNSLSFNSFGAHGTSREALAFTQKWQREDGKMAHELSQAAGYLDWWKGYPYGYIHGDTSPYYIVAMEDYVRISGDVAFLKTSWPSLLKAYKWCLTTDEDKDGLMDNSRAGLGALEFGSLTGIRTDIYLATVWTGAAWAMKDMAERLGDSATAAAAGAAAEKAAQALDAKFWDAANRQYSYAFNGDGALVKELTPWSALPLAWGFGDPERAVDTLAAMNAADMSTDWGVRMIAATSPLFEPLNYNYGAVWPFLSGWVSTALLRCGFAAQGLQTLRGVAAHTFDNALGEVTELFSGYGNIWPQEAVAHQGFSTSGFVLPLVRGLFGLEGDALRHEVRFEPAFPADWGRASVENWKVGADVSAVSYEREARKITVKVRSAGKGWRLVFAPALASGTRVVSASFDGAPLAVTPGPSGGQSARPVVEAVLTGEDTLTMTIEAAPEIVMPPCDSAPRELDRGLKIIRTDFAAPDLKILVEGLAGETYALDVRNGDRVAAVTGAAFDGSRLRLDFPAGPPGSFIRKEIVVRAKT